MMHAQVYKVDFCESALVGSRAPHAATTARQWRLREVVTKLAALLQVEWCGVYRALDVDANLSGATIGGSSEDESAADAEVPRRVACALVLPTRQPWSR